MGNRIRKYHQGIGRGRIRYHWVERRERAEHGRQEPGRVPGEPENENGPTGRSGKVFFFFSFDALKNVEKGAKISIVIRC